MKKSVFGKLLILLLALSAVFVIISEVRNYNETHDSEVEETDYEVSPPTLD